MHFLALGSTIFSDEGRKIVRYPMLEAGVLLEVDGQGCDFLLLRYGITPSVRTNAFLLFSLTDARSAPRAEASAKSQETRSSLQTGFSADRQDSFNSIISAQSTSTQ